MRSIFRTLVASSALCLAALVLAQGQPPVVSLHVMTNSVVAGKTFPVELTITFPEGLHGYQNPPTDPSLIPIAITAGDKVFKVIKVAYPKGTPTKIAGEDKPINVYSGTIKIPVMLQAPAKLGKAVFKLSVGYQECNDQSCFPPGSIVTDATVTVIKKAASASPKSGKTR